jgi:sulfite reductase alpha subunit-like flavoprotein
MGRDVVAELHAMAMQVGRKSQAEATAYVQKMEGEGRLIKELWS